MRGMWVGGGGRKGENKKCQSVFCGSGGVGRGESATGWCSITHTAPSGDGNFVISSLFVLFFFFGCFIFFSKNKLKN